MASVHNQAVGSFLLTAAVLLCCVFLVRCDLHCDSGWTLYYSGETCVKHFTNAQTWAQARSSCQGYDGDLIRIDDANKQNFFNSFHRGKSFSVWLGLRRTKPNANTFHWLDDPTANTYKYWANREPNNAGHREDCASTWQSNNQWNDISCASKFGFVCEKAAMHTAPRTCPPGWLMYGTSCYRFYLTKKTWNAGRSLCYSQGADLPTITDAGTTNFINKYYTNTNYRDIWIGLNDQSKVGDFRWSKGNAKLGSYKNWAPGQPSAPSTTRCIHLWAGAGHKWDDIRCDAKLSVLCQKTAPKLDVLCPSGWDLYLKGKKCVTLSRGYKTWTDARSFCKQVGGDLVKITDDLMNNYVLSRLPNPAHKYWIGVHKNANSAKLTWLDEVVKLSYSKAAGAYWPRSNEYCGTIRKTSQKWYNDLCTAKNYAVCERAAYARVQCPAGYTVNGYSCFKLSTAPLSWENARESCQADGGDLAKVTNYPKTRVVIAMLNNAKTPAWVGLHDRKKDNHFQWLDDTKDIKHPYYTTWGTNQPSDTDGTKNCVYLNNKDGHWYDGPCTDTKPYVCERGATVQDTAGKVKYLANTCPDGWSKQGPASGPWTCIKYNVDTHQWSDARKLCQKTGGDLIKIDNNDIAAFVNNLLTSQKATVEPYIGLSDRARKGNYAWLDEQKTATFTNWHQGEPNGDSEHCTVIIVDKAYENEWNDVDCRSRKGYICQQPATVPGSMYCGPGWEDSPDSDYCYRFNKDTLNWREAQNSCKVHGGNLMSVESSEEMLYLAGRMQSMDGDAFWSGGNDFDQGSGWQWTDGKPFGFFNWESKEPNGNQSDNCVSVNKDTGRWVASPCNQHMPSVCKKISSLLTHTTPAPTAHPTNIATDKVWGCKPTWRSYRDSCYAAYVNTDGVSWDAANKHCRSLSADLAAISDPQENNFVYSMIPRGFKAAWIGLNDFKRRFSFTWSDNVTPMTYAPWVAGEPSLNGLKQVCVAMTYYYGKWLDYECANPRKYFVCEAKSSLRDKSEWDPYKGCKKGGKGYNDKCYKFYSLTTATFDDAQKVCQGLGGNLATLNDRYTQAFVSSETPQQTYWIGLSNTKQTVTPYNQKAYLYNWQSGSSFDFANWDRDHTGQETQTCVAMSGTKPAGMWHNYPCASKKPYVCEYPRPGYTSPAPITTTTSLLPCPAGWTDIGHMCYKGIKGHKRSWMDANAYCKAAVSNGGALASVTSAGLENALIKNMIKTVSKVWIGLSDRDSEGGYTWAGGEPYVYQNWASGEPNNINSM